MFDQVNIRIIIIELKENSELVASKAEYINDHLVRLLKVLF